MRWSHGITVSKRKDLMLMPGMEKIKTECFGIMIVQLKRGRIRLMG